MTSRMRKRLEKQRAVLALDARVRAVEAEVAGAVWSDYIIDEIPSVDDLAERAERDKADRKRTRGMRIARSTVRSRRAAELFRQSRTDGTPINNDPDASKGKLVSPLFAPHGERSIDSKWNVEDIRQSEIAARSRMWKRSVRADRVFGTTLLSERGEKRVNCVRYRSAEVVDQRKRDSSERCRDAADLEQYRNRAEFRQQVDRERRLTIPPRPQFPLQASFLFCWELPAIAPIPPRPASGMRISQMVWDRGLPSQRLAALVPLRSR